MKIGILNYNAGNLSSVFYSLYRLGFDPLIVNKSKEIKNLDKLIIPGVGAANTCLDYLKKNELFDEIKKFYQSGKPIMGICLGLQIFSKKLYEHGESSGLGIINAEVISFKNLEKTNTGWLDVEINEESSIYNHLNKNNTFYFCHSFFLNFYDIEEKKYCVGYAKNQLDIPSILIKNNFIGTQFHPEKSQENGNKLIKFFSEWCPN